MPKGASTSVQVAVRCRPYLGKIDGNKSTFTCGVEMDGPSTRIFNPDTGEERRYTFDYSFWSFGNEDDHYMGNPEIYDKLGVLVLDQAWEGYNVSLFAYGQTGSGKSHSMIGSDTDPGIVPRASEEIFTRIEKIQQEQKDKQLDEKDCFFYDVKLGMIEIYNEEVRDLLNPKGTKPGGLRVRESKATGTYVEDLTYAKVRSYAAIEKTMEQGNAMRTVRSTKMNDKSSRAHTLIQIVLQQKKLNPKKNGDKYKISKESTINLVDLAGSEKNKNTGTQGAGMAEGIAINKSLSYLGKCITALAEKSQGRGKKQIVPYRESKLTFIMKNSLGGNSKTIMIAAIRPGADFYQESLSTLRYADQAKKIKTKAIKNEDPRDKAIKQLKQEVERLKGQLSGNPSAESGADMDEVQSLREQLMRSQKIISELNSPDESDEKSEEMERMRAAALSASGIGEKFDRSSVPHILNLQEDPQQSGLIAYPLKTIGDMTVGRSSPEQKPEIILSGLGIKKKHAIINRKDDSSLFISSVDGSDVHLNGVLVNEDSSEMKNNDRLIIGNNHVFKVVNPLQDDYNPDDDSIDWEFAQKEYAQAQGHLNSSSDEKQKEMEEKMKLMEQEFQRQQQAKEEELERRKKQMEEEMLQRQQEIASSNDDAGKMEELKKKLQEQQENFKRQQEEMAELQKKQEEEKKKFQEEQRAQEFNSWLEKRLLEMIPLVKDANEISKELKKPYEYELKVVHSIDENTGEPTSKLAVINKEQSTGLSTVWNDDDFTERLFKMKQLYGGYLDAVENNEKWDGVPEEDDPFVDENIDEAQTLGHSNILMESLVYLVQHDFYTDILDHSGTQVGEILVELIPCDESGDPDGVWDMLDIPEDTNTIDNIPDLIGKKFCFKLKIPGAKGLNKNRCEDSYCRYRLPLDTEWQETNVCSGRNVNPEWNYERLVVVDRVSPAFQEFLNKQMLNIEVFAKQSIGEKSKTKRKGLKEFKKEAEEMKNERDEAKMNLKYMSEERDDLQQENDELQNELDEVLEELEELQLQFFGDEGLLSMNSTLPTSNPKPSLSRQSSVQSVFHDDLDKLRGKIEQLENQKFQLEKQLTNGKAQPADLSEKELQLQKREEELNRREAELNARFPNSESTPTPSKTDEKKENHESSDTPGDNPNGKSDDELRLLKEKNELIKQQLKLEQQKSANQNSSTTCVIQ